MTNIILSTVCALALNTASLSAQADTADIYLIDYVKVENFNGSQLARKVIYSYTIQRVTVKGVPTRLHFINTGVMKDGKIVYDPSSSQPAVLLYDEDFNNGTAVSVGKPNTSSIDLSGGLQVSSLTPRTAEAEPSAVNAIYIVDETVVSEEEFKNLDPRNISSISIAKGASSIGVLRDLKGQGKYDGEIEGVNTVVVITKKKRK